jgi:outer membrane protein, adhesin transport system
MDLVPLFTFQPLEFPRVNFHRLAAPLVFATAFAPLPAFSLDLISAIQEVDGKHPQIQAKRQEAAAAESGLSAAKQQRLPSFAVITNRSSAQDSKTYATTRLQQPLFAGGRITAGIDQAQARIEESEATLGLTRRDLMTRTALAFHEVLKGQARLQVAQKSVEAHELLLESIGRRVSSEVSPESDLMLTRSRLSQAQTEKAQVQLALDRATDVLRELLERPAPALVPPAPRDPLAIDLMQALSEAEAYAPEIRQLSAQESIASAEVDLQKSAALPNVFVRYENLSNDRDRGLVREQTYLGLEFVPGAGFSVAQQIKAAESRRLAAIESRRAAEKDVRERVRAIWSDVSSLRLQVQSIRSYVSSALAVSESFSRQFTIGRKTWVEVLNATREYLQAELSLADIEWNLKIAELRLEIETGRFKPDSLN